MLRPFRYLILLLGSALTQAQTAPRPFSDPQNSGNWQLYEPMSDEFNGTAVDSTKWNGGTPSWDGRQPVFHTGNNATVGGGELRLTAKAEAGLPTGYRYSAGYLTSKKAKRYGYFEIRCRAADNLLATTFWLNGGSRVRKREIDILEVGAGSNVDVGLGTTIGRRRQVTNNFHTHATVTPTGLDFTDNVRPFDIDDIGFNLIDDFHVYGLEWNKDTCNFYVDGQLIRTAPTLDYKIGEVIYIGQEFNSFFAGKSGADIVDSNIERGGAPVDYRIDYVRTWIKPQTNQRYYVDPTNGNDSSSGLSWATAKKSVGGAVDAAFDGDSIWIAAGTYNEQLDISGIHGMTLLGGFTSGMSNVADRNPEANPVILNAFLGFSGLYLDANDGVTVDGLTFQGANKSFTNGVTATGFMKDTVLRNCIIRNNVPANGAGAGAFIAADRDSIALRFERCQFLNNRCVGSFPDGGALASRGPVTITVDGCQFTGNEGQRGGAIRFSSPDSALTIQNSLFTNNTAQTGRGIIDTNRGTVRVINNTFANQAFDLVRMEATTDLANSTISNNIFAGSAGNAVWLQGSLPANFVQNNLFFNNGVAVQYSGPKTMASAVNPFTWAQGNIDGNPLFTNAASGDFSLQSGSPAKDTGLASIAPGTDFRGTARPQDAGPEIGAFEIPPPVTFFTATDIGAAPSMGSTVESTNFCLESTATGLASTSDNIHFAHRPATGDFTFVARLDSLTAGAKAGVMVRSNTAANASHQALQVAGTMAQPINRLTPGSTSNNGLARLSSNLPQWLRVRASLGVVTMMTSQNGTDWTVMGLPAALPGSSPLIGLYTSGGKAIFSQVSYNAGTDNLFSVAITQPSSVKSLIVPTIGSQVALRGEIINQNSPGNVTSSWALRPTDNATIFFQNTTSASVFSNQQTTAEISYTGTDGTNSITDYRQVHFGTGPAGVTAAPTIDAGSDLLILTNQATALGGLSSSAATFWSRVLGPASSITIANPGSTTAAAVTATAAGNFQLRLSANFNNDLVVFADRTVSSLLDADNDGIEDGWETSFGLDPGSAADATLDSDGDGISNRVEFLFGTTPNDKSSLPVLHTRGSATSSQGTLAFPTNDQRIYQIQEVSRLDLANWTTLMTVERTGSEVQVPINLNDGQHFYRMSATLAP